MMLGPRLDCTETRRLNQVASLSERMNGVDRTSEEDDGGVGEATGEEGGERGEVRGSGWGATEVASVVSA